MNKATPTIVSAPVSAAVVTCPPWTSPEVCEDAIMASSTDRLEDDATIVVFAVVELTC